MTMRTPGFGGTENRRAEGGDQGIPDDHPVLLAMLNAPTATEPMTEDELMALEEWRANPTGVDEEIVTAMIAERAARER